MKKTGIKILLMVLIVTMLIPSVVVASACEPKYEDLGDVDINILDAIEVIVEGIADVLDDPENAAASASVSDVIENAPKNASINYNNSGNVTVGTSRKLIYTFKNADGRGRFKSKTSTKNLKFKYTGADGYYDFVHYFTSRYSSAVTGNVTTKIAIYTDKNQKKPASSNGGSYLLKNNTRYYVRFDVINKNESKVNVCLGAKMHVDAANIKKSHKGFSYKHQSGASYTANIYNSKVWKSTVEANVDTWAVKKGLDQYITDYKIYINRRDLLILNYLITYPDFFKSTTNKNNYKDLISKVNALANGATATEREAVINSWNTLFKPFKTDLAKNLAVDMANKLGAVIEKASLGTIVQLVTLFDISLTNKGTKLMNKINSVASGEFDKGRVVGYNRGVEIEVYQHWYYDHGLQMVTVKPGISVKQWEDNTKYSKTNYIFGAAGQKGSFQAIGITELKAIGKLSSRYDVKVSFAGITIV